MASMALHMNLLAPKQAMTWDQSMNQKVFKFFIVGPTQNNFRNLEENFLQQFFSTTFIRKTKINKKKSHTHQTTIKINPNIIYFGKVEKTIKIKFIIG
jgi:hypothetical protein